MDAIPFSEIRERFTDIAQKVQFEKRIYITKKNNKPAVGIVPIEYVSLLLAMFKNAKDSKDIADLVSQHVMFLAPDDFSQLESVLQNPPKPTREAIASAVSSARLFKV